MTHILSEGTEIEIGPLSDTSLPKVLASYSGNKIIIVVDENTHDLCLEYLITSFPALEKSEIILLPNGEENKVMEVCIQVWNAFSEYGFSRKDLVLNLGGGMVTDMGGFIASVFKRGMDFIHIPTSLLAMVDAAIGGKNGIDLGPHKNQLGTIVKAKNVFIDLAFLQTLPAKEFYNGYAEIKSQENYFSPNIPKVIFNPRTKFLMYMSRAAIPSNKTFDFVKAWKQVCIYAYPKNALKAFSSAKKTTLEEKRHFRASADYSKHRRGRSLGQALSE